MNNTSSVQSAKETVDTSWQLLSLLVVGLLVSMLPSMSFAQNAATTPFDTVICNVVNFFTGTTGKAIATIAVIFVGIGALMGKISWGLAFIVAVGIALIFGAASIVNAVATGVSGSGGAGCQAAR
jgi:type IV secretion system protein VirB2